MYDFLTQPLEHNKASRTAREVWRDACAIQKYERRVTWQSRALYATGALACFVVAALIHYGN